MLYDQALELIRSAHMTQAEVARHLGMLPSGLWLKLRGQRPLLAPEAAALADLLAERLGRQVTVDELIGRQVGDQGVQDLSDRDQAPAGARRTA